MITVYNLLSIPEETRTLISNMSYEDMLRRWRFAPVGDPIFIGESGEYYKEIMAKKRKQVGIEAHIETSKRIGWKSPSGKGSFGDPK